MLHRTDDEKTINEHFIDLKGKPRSLEDEKKEWTPLSFPPLPPEEKNASIRLTASQLQGYVSQKLCPRWARFQQMGYQIPPHPRFKEIEREISSQQEKGIAFKKRVIEQLQNTERVCFETEELSWQQAIQMVLLDKKPLFLIRPKLKIHKTIRNRAEISCGSEPHQIIPERSLSGSPDLIYIHHQGTHLCLEVWNITFSQSLAYAQKWRVAFYAHLLDSLLKDEIFFLPIKVSALGGLVCPPLRPNKPFEKHPFVLAPYKAWMARLIVRWQIDAERNSAVQNYFMESSCTSCRYFSYCYQETLFKDLPLPANQAIVSQNLISDDFPKNSKHWYFIYCDKESAGWQCWENGVPLHDLYIYSRDFSDEEEFRKEFAAQLQMRWMQSSGRHKNPHCLVYEPSEWHHFHKTFQSMHLKLLKEMHVCWTSIETILKTHFIWPIHGRMTAGQVGACLGFSNHPAQPLSLYHQEPFSKDSFDIYRQIWNWCLSNVKSSHTVSFEEDKEQSPSLIQSYFTMHRLEAECRLTEILNFQKNSLPERVKQFRSIGPLNFLGSSTDKKCYSFSMEEEQARSKFRVGDFLKLSPVGSCDIQEGFSVVLDTYFPDEGILSVRPLSKKINVSKHQTYALDEDATDSNGPKIIRVLNLLREPNFRPDLIQILMGRVKTPTSNGIDWIEEWYPSRAFAAGLNLHQRNALKLPFREKIGLIEGPPGTGKTHLLVWTLIALAAHAQFLKHSLKILVSAQTHHAIDQILVKFAKTLPSANIASISLWKYGRFNEGLFPRLGIGCLQNVEQLNDRGCLIIGATGFGIYQLLEDKKFPQFFDWVVFDESSQMLTPYALLSLVFGKGGALFYGDTQQLSPVLKGNYANTSFIPHSILQELMTRYGSKNRLRLNETYRMNAEICKFASEEWYEGELYSIVAEKDQLLKLPHYPLYGDYFDDCLDPSRPMTVAQLKHTGSLQSSEEEAKWIAQAVKRLMEDYSIYSEQIGIISPHRLQNNTILSALKETLPYSLKLPRVDTVERMQGAEFDLVIFSATVSDQETIHSSFLKSYRRFNVAITRARKKFIFVASELFFESFPTTEQKLIAQMPFENFFNRFIIPVK